MKKKAWWIGGLAVALAAIGLWLDPTRVAIGYLRGEAFLNGRPTSYWRAALNGDDPPAYAEAHKAVQAAGVDALGVLTELLQHDGSQDWNAAKIRWTAAQRLGDLGPRAKSAGPVLATALNDPDPHVRAVAVVSLGKTEAAPPAALPILLAMLHTDERLHAVRTLGSYGLAAQEAVPALRKLLYDAELEVRLSAIETLGKIGAPAEQVVPDLIPLLEDESETLREYAVEALGRIGDAAKPAIEEIVPLVEDSEAAVRAAAARTLRTLDPARFADLPAVPPPPSKPKS